MTKTKALQITVAGTDTATISRAQKLSKRLAAELEPGLPMNSQVWNFRAFGDRELLKEAARRTAKSDLIIVAGNSAMEPSPFVKEWIESSLSRKRKGVAAVVPFCGQDDETPSATSPLCVYLRRITARWGMDFLTRSAEGWQHNFEFLAECPDGAAK